MTTTPPYLPEETRVYAIGDIHGGLNLLEKLMDMISANDHMLPPKQNTYLIFLGDYIDRGTNSKQVVDYLLNTLPSAYIPVFLKGNHEQMMLDCLTKNNRGNIIILDHWLYNGGQNTIRSYGIEESSYPEETQLDFIAALSPEHRAFYQDLQLSFEIGHYFFCHAGIRPGVALSAQKPEELLWIRGLFLNSTKDHGKIIVHGHTPDIAQHYGNRIALDSGSVMSGKLTAIRLEADGSHEFLTALHNEEWANM